MMSVHELAISSIHTLHNHFNNTARTPTGWVLIRLLSLIPFPLCNTYSPRHHALLGVGLIIYENARGNTRSKHHTKRPPVRSKCLGSALEIGGNGIAHRFFWVCTRWLLDHRGGSDRAHGVESTMGLNTANCSDVHSRSHQVTN